MKLGIFVLVLLKLILRERYGTRWKRKKKKIAATNFIEKFTPTNNDIQFVN